MLAHGPAAQVVPRPAKTLPACKAHPKSVRIVHPAEEQHAPCRAVHAAHVLPAPRSINPLSDKQLARGPNVHAPFEAQQAPNRSAHTGVCGWHVTPDSGESSAPPAPKHALDVVTVHVPFAKQHATAKLGHGLGRHAGPSSTCPGAAHSAADATIMHERSGAQHRTGGVGHGLGEQVVPPPCQTLPEAGLQFGCVVSVHAPTNEQHAPPHCPQLETTCPPGHRADMNTGKQSVAERQQNPTGDGQSGQVVENVEPAAHEVVTVGVHEPDGGQQNPMTGGHDEQLDTSVTVEAGHVPGKFGLSTQSPLARQQYVSGSCAPARGVTPSSTSSASAAQAKPTGARRVRPSTTAAAGKADAHAAVKVLMRATPKLAPRNHSKRLPDARLRCNEMSAASRALRTREGLALRAYPQPRHSCACPLCG